LTLDDIKRHCQAVRSAILATAGLLVKILSLLNSAKNLQLKSTKMLS